MDLFFTSVSLRGNLRGRLHGNLRGNWNDAAGGAVNDRPMPDGQNRVSNCSLGAAVNFDLQPRCLVKFDCRNVTVQHMVFSKN